MRLVVSLLVLAALLWSGYWALGARALETGLAAWIAERRQEGWAADYATLDVTGFPARFDTTITALTLADPETGLAWSVPEFRFEARSHRPNDITAIWPPTQQISTPREKIAVGAGQMSGNLTFRPGPALEVARADYTLEGFSLASTEGWSAGVARATLRGAAVEDRTHSHRIRFDAADMRLPARLVALLDRAGVLPDLFERLTVEAVVGFDAPWDRRAIEDRRPQITRIELGLLDATWGRLALQAAGALDVAEGRPEGTLTVRATNWREMIAIARASGQLPEGLADRLEDALGVLAGLSGRPETLDVPLRFALGRTWLGPVPLGPAPDFTIR